LEKPFEALLKRLSPDFVIHDIVQHWIPCIIAKLGIPTLTFLVTSAVSIGYGHGHSSYQNPTAKDLTIPPPGFPSTAVHRLLFEARKVLHLYNKIDNHGCPTFMDHHAICFEECWAIACNTCVELEEAYVEHLHTTTGWLEGISWRERRVSAEDSPVRFAEKGKEVERNVTAKEEEEYIEEEVELTWIQEKVEDLAQFTGTVVQAIPGPRVGQTSLPWLVAVPLAYM
ncbi:hypothetical protein KI387_033313, partial [Taxus chinensis]